MILRSGDDFCASSVHDIMLNDSGLLTPLCFPAPLDIRNVGHTKDFRQVATCSVLRVPTAETFRDIVSNVCVNITAIYVIRLDWLK